MTVAFWAAQRAASMELLRDTLPDKLLVASLVARKDFYKVEKMAVQKESVRVVKSGSEKAAQLDAYEVD